jgi:hypothetical protein
MKIQRSLFLYSPLRNFGSHVLRTQQGQTFFYRSHRRVAYFCIEQEEIYPNKAQETEKKNRLK